MISKKKIIAIIPARGGSKRLPNKNIRNMAGLPLIVYTILAAKKSQFIDEIVVSSDSDTILEIAKKHRCTIHKRKSYLSKDDSKTISLLKELLNCYQGYEIVVTLQPTSPLRTSKDIDNAIKLYIRKNAKSVVSVCKAEHSPYLINTLGDDLSMKNFASKLAENSSKRNSNDFFRLNGAIYCNDTQLVKIEDELLIKEETYAYIMPIRRSIDIDTLEDFLFAEYLIKNQIN
jgi:CMP-N,N'-diacetyllegionaminic acid synthase